MPAVGPLDPLAVRPHHGSNGISSHLRPGVPCPITRSSLLAFTYHVEFQLHVEDPPAVQNGHQVDGEDGGSVRRDRYVWPKEYIEVHRESVQFVAQSGPDGPALVGVDGGGEVDDAVLRGARVAVVVEGAR